MMMIKKNWWEHKAWELAGQMKIKIVTETWSLQQCSEAPIIHVDCLPLLLEEATSYSWLNSQNLQAIIPKIYEIQTLWIQIPD